MNHFGDDKRMDGFTHTGQDDGSDLPGVLGHDTEVVVT